MERERERDYWNIFPLGLQYKPWHLPLNPWTNPHIPYPQTSPDGNPWMPGLFPDIHWGIQWHHAYLLHFYDMIWYFYAMLSDIKNDMIWYAIVWYGILWYAMLWDLSKRSIFHRRVSFILHFQILIHRFFSIKTHF